MFKIRYDLSGMRFGRLVALHTVKRTGKYARWLCRCDCGTENEVDSVNLKNGSTQSCGCMRSELQTVHGHNRRGKRSPTYHSWTAMIARCKNPNHAKFMDYGGRGIKVCDRWLLFENFLSDMGERPEGRTIERNNNSGDYEPSNCRWATPLEQAHNKRPRRDTARNAHAAAASTWRDSTSGTLTYQRWQDYAPAAES